MWCCWIRLRWSTVSYIFWKKVKTLGFDISEKKIINYKNNKDPNNEISQDEFLKSKLLKFSNEPKKLKNCDFIIVAVPTPIDAAKNPDLRLLKNATKTIAENMKSG